MYAQIRAEYLDLLAPLMASNSEVRSYLKGVAIQPHPEAGVYIVATDGHRIGVFHDESGIFRADEQDTLIVPVPKELQQAGRPRRSERLQERVFTWSDGMGSVTLEDEGEERTKQHILWSASLDRIDEKFPDWTRVVPKHVTAASEATVNAVNPAYLMDFCRIAKAADTVYPTISLHHGKEDEAMVILTGREDFIGVLMPMRRSTGPDDVPDWAARAG